MRYYEFNDEYIARVLAFIKENNSKIFALDSLNKILVYIFLYWNTTKLVIQPLFTYSDFIKS